ncbi:hypothetical protein NHX12_032488 [Muraenolepis orangiensis]|uniref:Coiled-coil domain-containing protein 137 n=1 Tax=Muraenolepis orangiensis TaxID=630683 RepID=A0A9Q0E9U6_9TELE|nr:hypothetical protein NHX12_032488 [Muraenolepis orangiensis]
MGKKKHGGKAGPKDQREETKPGREVSLSDNLDQVPFRLREIMKSQELMKKKKGKPTSKKTKAPVPKPRPGHPRPPPVGDIPVPHFKRGKQESKKAYLSRMDQEVDHVLYLTKNQVQRKPELNEDQTEKTTKNKSQSKIEHNKERLQRLKYKRLKGQEKELERTMFTDTVKFGEVVLAPPTLSAKPRKAPIKNMLSKGLLLNSLLGQTSVSTVAPSMARKRIMEEERQRVVEAYRHLKRQKNRQNELKAAALKTLKNL